jgi:hypothetical protein
MTFFAKMILRKSYSSHEEELLVSGNVSVSVFSTKKRPLKSLFRGIVHASNQVEHCCRLSLSLSLFREAKAIKRIFNVVVASYI